MAIFRRKPSAAPPAPDEAETPRPAPPAPGPRRISLALQGGGAHGAFQWGVLDRLLEEDDLEIAAITAASAGAMNAAALVAGLMDDGRRGARAKLDRFWRAVNQAGGRNVFGDSAIWTAAFSPRWMQANPFYRYFETALVSMSPYDFNPFNLNPLRDLLQKELDFAAIRDRSPVRLFVSATDVWSGKAKVFRTKELNAEVLLASGCLPHLHHAVEIDGRPYWDGAYMGNPALWPLFYEDTPRDLLLVTLNPIKRDQTPRTAGEILDRVNEITFNGALMAELRAVAFVQELIESDLLKPEGRTRLRHVLTHAVTADGWLDDLPLATKFETEWTFLTDLKQRGRQAAQQWVETCLPHVGERSTLDIHGQMLGQPT